MLSGMQGTARAAAGSHGEILLALLDALLLVSAGNGMLETGGVGGVTGDGNVHALLVHDSDAFADVVGAVAAYICPLGRRSSLYFLTTLQFAGVVVKLGLHVGKAVDPGDDLSSILSQAVQDHPQRLLPSLVGHFGDADGAFSSREGLVACQESEALVSLRAAAWLPRLPWPRPTLRSSATEPWNAESLQAFADSFAQRPQLLCNSS